jgi:hypothetical protein
MKAKYIITLMLILVGMVFYSCKENDDNGTQPLAEETPLTLGQNMTYSFVEDEDTVVKMVDEVVNLGISGFPVIFLVHKETPILQTGFEDIFFPLYRERLAEFMLPWAEEFNLPHITDMDKAIALKDFRSFFVHHDIDPGLLVELILGEGRDLKPIVHMVNEAATLRDKTKCAIPDANDLLYRLYQDNISPEDLLATYKPVPQLKQTFCIIMMIFNATVTYTKWVNFIADNQAIENVEVNEASFVGEGDTIASHYSGGIPFRSKDYALSYDVGKWEAKVTYHLEGTYADSHASIPGYYVASFNTVPTRAEAHGPGFIVEAKTQYSPPVNIGSLGVPVATYDGQVKTIYGDCCCFRKISYLNFTLNSQTGYTEVHFSKGK